ncbi:MAG: efflux RND transporter periplasmic adaptor subunit [Desulfamplus sp.]|nr:efflux RND transporter periplasmic adaptor subunit [Desulfamplus sp.]
MKDIKNRSVGRWLKLALRFLMPIVIIAAGIAGAKYLYDTKPLAQRGRSPVQPPLVQTLALETTDHHVVITAMGEVIPSRKIQLRSRVSGYVAETADDFFAGGIFSRGQVIMKLDQEDYKIVLNQQKAILDRARASLKLEMGRQEVARAELDMMQRTTGKTIMDTNLALRVPQLEQIKAEIASIEADLAKARLNLERTVIRAPFNCMIMSANAEAGSSISVQETLAEITGTDTHRVEAVIPVDHLGWVLLPSMAAGEKGRQGGSVVTITTKEGETHNGEVIRLLGEISGRSRMARLLIRIDDPMGLATPKTFPLLLGSYVQVAIEGKKLEGIIAVSRSAVRDGEYLWIARRGKLFMEKMNVIWKNQDNFFLKPDENISPGAEIVISELSSPVHGMDIRSDGIGIKADGMGIKADEMDIKADEMDIKADEMDIKADGMGIKEEQGEKGREK